MYNCVFLCQQVQTPSRVVLYAEGIQENNFNDWVNEWKIEWMNEWMNNKQRRHKKKVYYQFLPKTPKVGMGFHFVNIINCDKYWNNFNNDNTNDSN